MRKTIGRAAIVALVVTLGAASNLFAQESPAVLHLAEAANGQTVTATAGQRVVIELKANPTTGYAWFLESFPSSLELVKFSFTPGGTNMPGAGGTQTVEFRAKSPGTAAIDLVYRRPWEKSDAPGSQTFSVKIAIQ